MAQNSGHDQKNSQELTAPRSDKVVEKKCWLSVARSSDLTKLGTSSLLNTYESRKQRD